MTKRIPHIAIVAFILLSTCLAYGQAGTTQTQTEYPKLSGESLRRTRRQSSGGVLTEAEIKEFITEWMDDSGEKRVNFRAEVQPLQTRTPPPAGKTQILLSAQLTQMDLKLDWM